MNRLELWRRPSSKLFSFDSEWDTLFENPFGMYRREYTPATEIQETESHFVLSFDVPGMSKDDVNIEVEGDTLTVSGERKSELEDNRNAVHHTERSYGAFTRAFTLPKGTDTSNIEANYKDGVLRVAVPKSEEAKPRKVEIKAEEGGFFKKLLNTSKSDKEKLAS